MDLRTQISAARLGFRQVPCSVCASLPGTACPNCEGSGFVWRQGLTTLASSGLVRFAAAWADGSGRDTVNLRSRQLR
jgi:hypothetical protein